MKTYGLSKSDLRFCRDKVSDQRTYLTDTHFTTSNGEVKTLMDVSFSANHSPRYYAQLANKINTMSDYAKSINHIGIFTTMTLDGFFRDLLRGDYARFDKLSDMKKAIALKSVPNNDAQGYIRDKILNNERLSIPELNKILTYQNKLFLASYTFKKMKKAGVKYSYIRTAEPHKDGVPHFHAMFFIPEEFKERLKTSFINAYPAPQNSRVIDDKGQLQGFQWDIKNAAAYVMKYITKSFMDVKNQKELDYLQAWYVKHRIMRVVTSHSVVPQWVYQKLVPLEKDWFHLTDLLRDKDRGSCEWSKEDDYIRFTELSNGRTIEYDKGVYCIMWDDRVIKQFGERKTKPEEYYERCPGGWKEQKNKTLDYIDVYFDDEHYFLKGDNLIPDIKKPYQMGDMELYEYFHDIDIETVDLNHYAVTRNMMIDKGLLTGEPVKASEFLRWDF